MCYMSVYIYIYIYNFWYIEKHRHTQNADIFTNLAYSETET